MRLLLLFSFIYLGVLSPWLSCWRIVEDQKIHLEQVLIVELLINC
jgi:hypothetical protein